MQVLVRARFYLSLVAGIEAIVLLLKTPLSQIKLLQLIVQTTR